MRPDPATLGLMLADLLAHDGVVEDVWLSGTVGFMALHGGIESGTAELARQASQRAGASLYVVEQPEDLWWHVPSTNFDPADSSGLRRFVDHVTCAVSLHGFGRPGMQETVLLGGRNREMAARMATVMRKQTATHVIDELEEMPRTLRGVHPRNPVNLPPGSGVQIELTADLREGPASELIVEAMVTSARAEMAQLEAG